jgi:WD40 repeat protein/serine/threonine protein kinase
MSISARDNHSMTSGYDPVLDDVIEEMANRLQAGEPVDGAAILAKYPDRADSIRRLLPAMEVMAEFGVSASRLAASGVSPGLSPLTGEPGTLGDFRILRQVGRGGMGIVYEAEQLSLSRRVALKVLPFAGAMDPHQLRRFRTEAQAAAQLHHTNIVPVFWIGCENGVHYYAMQFIEGRTLADVIRELRQLEGKDRRDDRASKAEAPGDLAASALASALSREFPPPAAREDVSPPAAAPDPPGPSADRALAAPSGSSTRNRAYFRNVARLGLEAAQALEHAHQEGIVHRDIKPANLMIDVRGHLWVTDFGLARLQGDSGLTSTGDLLGTLRYMSPEQALGKRAYLDHRTDIYSLGATLYELFTLRPAIDGRDRQEILARIAQDEPVLPRRLHPAIPRELETILLKSMSKEPESRYSTARELADDLERFLQHRPIRAKRPTLRQKIVKWVMRHPAAVATAIIAGLVILGLLGLGAWQAHHLRQVRGLARSHEEVIRRRDDAARHERYVTDVHIASQLIRNGEAGPGESILDRHRPAPGEEDPRGFEWYYLKGLIHQERASLSAHEGKEVYHVEFAPDGRTLASSGQDGTVHIWDAATLRLLRVLRGHTDEVNWVTYSPDGTMLVTASDDRTVRLWDADGRPVRVLKGHTEPVVAALFTPDGRRIVSGGRDARVRVWDVATGVEQGSRSAAGAIEGLAISPGGPLLAAGGNTFNRQLLNLRRVPMLEERRLQATHRFHHVTRSVALALDGRTLAATCERHIDLYDTATGRLRAILHGHAKEIQTAAFSPDGRWLATAGDDATIRIWDPASESQSAQRVLTGHGDRIWCVAFSPEGRTIATASRDGTIKLWDTDRHRDRTLLTLSEGPSLVTMAAGEVSIVHVDTSGQVRTWNPLTGRAQLSPARVNLHGVRRHQGGFSPDGRFLAGWSDRRDRIQLADVRTGRLLWEVPGKVGPLGFGLAFSPDSTRLLCTDDLSVRILDTATGREQHVPDPMRRVGAFLPGEGLLVTRRWGDPNGEQTLSIWNGPSGRDWVSKDIDRSLSLSCTSVSTDGRILAIAWSDRVIRLLDCVTLAERAVLKGHASDVLSLCFSRDGRTLASGGYDRTIRLWDVATGQEFFAFHNPRALVSGVVRFTPDGRTLVCRNELPQGSFEFILWHATRQATDERLSVDQGGQPEPSVEEEPPVTP